MIDVLHFFMYFKDIGINKTTGVNHLLDKVFRLTLSYIAPLLCDIINRAIYESHFPSLWKIAVVTPLHKGGDREDMSNCHPISVLPILSKKVYEKLILNYLFLTYNTNNIICTTQSGFRSDHSTTSAMHHLISQWTNIKKSSDALALLFLDLRKVFDLIVIDTLLTKLNAIGVQGEFFSFKKMKAF